MTAALEASGEEHSTRVWTATLSRQNHPWEVDSGIGQPNYDTNLICINADQLPLLAQEVGPEFFRNRYNIGLWFWETELFPASMHAGFDFLHEVWVASEFVRQAIAAASPVPVFTMPLPLRVAVPLAPAPERAALNLPEGFLFLFSFDFFSVAERKNAVAVIHAFAQAFAPDEGAALLIKSINGHTNRAELERLHHARAGRTDIILQDGYLSRPENDALFAACDCYVSLHRSEGFGLTIAEAMLQEKPAIATRYSGNLEFMDDSNSFLCGYNLRRVGDDAPPYPPDAEWADPDVDEASRLMRFVRQHPEEAQERGRKARADLCARHHPGVAGVFIQKRLAELRQQPPRPVPFTAIPPERASITQVRTALEREVNVRQTVPSLLTWIFQGPRRAMKQFLRVYDEHLRRIGLAAVAVSKEIDAEWLRERGALTRRVATQEYELERMKRALNKTEEQLRLMEARLEDARQRAENEELPRAGNVMPPARDNSRSGHGGHP
jgi:glycosyltransferase involved in cell wall biosynthesis